MNGIGPGFVAVVGLIAGVAVVALLVSKQAQTPQVFTSAGGALAGVLGAAVSPVTGSTSYTNMFGGGTSGVQGVTQ